MVNNQTSQYKLLFKFFYLSCGGIFQYVRAILQLSLPIDHPVAVIVFYPVYLGECNPRFTHYVAISTEAPSFPIHHYNCTLQQGMHCQVYITALHQGLSKCLTAQDTHFSPTPTKHSRTLSSYGNPLAFQSQYTIQVYRLFLCLGLSIFNQKLDVGIS